MLVATVQSCLASSLGPCFPIFRFRQDTKLHWATGTQHLGQLRETKSVQLCPPEDSSTFSMQMLNVKATSNALKHQLKGNNRSNQWWRNLPNSIWPLFKFKGTSLPYKNYSSCWKHPTKIQRERERDHQRMLPRLSWETERPKTKCAYIYIYVYTCNIYIHLSFCPNDFSIMFIMHPPRNQHRPWREEKHGSCKFVLVPKFAFEVQ